MQETWVWFLGWEDPLEKEMATHSSILAWRIPWKEEPGGLQSTGLQRVGHDWVTKQQQQGTVDTKWIWDDIQELLVILGSVMILSSLFFKSISLGCLQIYTDTFISEMPWHLWFSSKWPGLGREWKRKQNHLSWKSWIGWWEFTTVHYLLWYTFETFSN